MAVRRVHYRMLAEYPGQGEVNALAGKPFTGVAFDEYPNGQLRRERTYKKGRLWGPRRTWLSDGQPRGSAYFVRGTIHGVHRASYDTGAKEEIAIYQYGVCVRRKRWGLDGRVLEDFALPEDDPQREELRQREAKFRKLVEAEEIPPEYLQLTEQEWALLNAPADSAPDAE